MGTRIPIVLPTSAELDAYGYPNPDDPSATILAQALVVSDQDGNDVHVVAHRLAVDGSGVTQPVSVQNWLAPAEVHSVNTSASAVIVMPTHYFGWTARETSQSSPAGFRIRDGGGGTILDDIELDPAESSSDWFGDRGKAVHTSLYFELIAGAFELSVFADV